MPVWPADSLLYESRLEEIPMELPGFAFQGFIPQLNKVHW
jgi:hypothetical protein